MEARQPKTDGNRPLIIANVNWLKQALSLLQQLDDDKYTRPPKGLEPHQVGSHLRHILEFYECFLDGLDSSHIDYDARRRDESIEKSRNRAAEKIRALIHRLTEDPAVRMDPIVFVRMEHAEDERPSDPFMFSSVRRELQVLSSHTIHHFALIAVTMRAHGLDVDPTFGMAPSTLRYHAARTGCGAHLPARTETRAAPVVREVVEEKTLGSAAEAA